MEKILIIVSLFYFLSCATVPTNLIQSYSTEISLADSEIAWSRAHAYLAKKRFNMPAFHLSSNQYLIQSGPITVTREFSKNNIIIRITSSKLTPILKEAPRVISMKDLIEIISEKNFMTSLLLYIKTGDSMKDEDLDDLRGEGDW